MTQYHITLNGQGYVLDLDRYQKRIRDPFAGKQAQGAVGVGDLRGPELLLVISDWSGGEGAAVYAGDGRYRSGSNVDVASVPGALRLGPQFDAAIVSFGLGESSVIIPFWGHLIIGLSNNQVYRHDGSTTTLIGTCSGIPRTMEVFLSRLYVGCEGTGNVAEITTWGFTNPKFTVPGGIYGVWTLRLFYQQAISYLFVGAGGPGLNGIGRAYIFDGAALGPGEQDFEEIDPLAAAVLNGRLHFASSIRGGTARMGLYSVDDSGSGGVWRQHGGIWGLYCTDMAFYNGALYLGCSPGGVILKWDGSTLTRVYQLGTLAAPHTGEIRGMAVWNGALWIGSSDASGGFLLRYDGTGWSRPVAGLTNSAPRSLAVFQGQLYLSTATTTIGTLFKTGGGVRLSGTLDSGLIDCGLPAVGKLFKSVTLVTSALGTGQTVQVQYRLEDTGAWTTLGTLSGGGATTATYSFGANTAGRQIELRVNLSTSSAGNGSPVLYQLGLRYVPRPTVVREWELAVVLDGTAELPLITLDQAPEPLTGAQLSAALWSAAGVTGPVTLTDIDGSSYAVYVQDIKEEVGQISQRRGYQRLGLVKLVEAAA